MRDSNSRPLGPKPSTLAIWANPRHFHMHDDFIIIQYVKSRAFSNPNIHTKNKGSIKGESNTLHKMAIRIFKCYITSVRKNKILQKSPINLLRIHKYLLQQSNKSYFNVLYNINITYHLCSNNFGFVFVIIHSLYNFAIWGS